MIVAVLGKLYRPFLRYVCISARRSRSSSTTARGSWARMVSSATTVAATISAIPTAGHSLNPVYTEGESAIDINGTVQYGWNVWYDSYGNLLSGHPLQYCMAGWIERSM